MASMVPAFALAFGAAEPPPPRLWDGRPVMSPAQLLHPHTDVAHRHWADILQHSAGELQAPLVVDATAGNGHDTVVLAEALARAGGGRLLVCDVQRLALDRSRERLKAALSSWHGWDLLSSDEPCWRAVRREPRPEPAADAMGAELAVEWHLRDQAELLEGLARGSASLVVFNLGYLPGGDKQVVTTAGGTMRALVAAERAVRAGGTVSATIYPGHDEGRREEEAVLDHASGLPQGEWSVHHVRWLNQRSKRTGVRAPSVLLMQRMHAGEAEAAEPGAGAGADRNAGSS